jgi:hypothetical protein
VYEGGPEGVPVSRDAQKKCVFNTTTAHLQLSTARLLVRRGVPQRVEGYTPAGRGGACAQ